MKNKILDIISPELRFLEFRVEYKIPYEELIKRLIPCLTPLGMTIEKSSDKNGCPVILFQKMIYDVFYDDNTNTFNIWWRKNVARALLTVDSINTYRKIVVAMGIIGYSVQQSCSRPVIDSSGMKQEENTDTINAEQPKRFCANCGTEIDNSPKFCIHCGHPTDF